MPFTTRSTSTPGNPGEPVDYRRRLLVVPAMMTMFIAGAVDAAPNPTGSPSASVAGKADAWPYSATVCTVLTEAVQTGDAKGAVDKHGAGLPDNLHSELIALSATDLKNLKANRSMLTKLAPATASQLDPQQSAMCAY